MPLIRARDVRTYIAELGFEKGVVQSLERLLDDYAETRQYLREITELLSKVIDQYHALVQVGDGLRRSIDEVRRVQQQGDQHGEREG